MSETNESKSRTVRLFSGERYVLGAEDAVAVLKSGEAEIYASSHTDVSSSYRQIYLVERIPGDAVFAAASDIGYTEIFIYAASDVELEVYPTGVREKSDGEGGVSVEDLRDWIRGWFGALRRNDWLGRFADLGYEMISLWGTENFLGEAETAEALWHSFDEHQEVLEMFLSGRFKREDTDSEKRLQYLKKQDEQLRVTAVKNLLGQSAVLPQTTSMKHADIDLVAFIVGCVARRLGMERKDLTIDPDILKNMGQTEIIRRFCQKAGVAIRLITLEPGWEHNDCGTILGYYGEKKELCALIPETPDSYRLVLQGNSEGIPVTEEIAAKIDPDAFVCYAGFPARKLTVRDVLHFMFTQCWKEDYRTILVISIVSGLIPLVTPIITQTIFADIIPIRDWGSLATVTQVMMVTGFTTAALGLVRTIAVMRISLHLDMAVEAALWNRLLSLPTKFFRRYQTGELLSRMGGINAIKSMLTGSFVGSVFGLICSFWSLGLMCWYSLKLTGAAMLLWFVYFIIIAFCYRRVLGFQRELIGAKNKTAGRIQQLFSSLAKFRIQGAETRAFYLWAEKFGEEWKWNLNLRWQGNYNSVIAMGQPVFLNMLLYYFVMNSVNDPASVASGNAISYSNYLAFSAAFSAFNGTIVGFVPLAMQLFGAIPQIENVRPILDEEPEITEDKQDAEVLSGAIEARHLTFGYNDTRDILKDVSFKIVAGETVAIVGPSGCGKSTLLRVLLGFEKPKQGAVYYDGQDLDALSVGSVRSQMGVVLQSGQLMAGDILTNIIGTKKLTEEDAWEAAEQAGIADDIRSMPMGMRTLISEGAGNISGGQRQRLMIARAIVGRPAILVFDEATSALDNRSQSIVTESLAKMHSTRIIVAHRLSTIQDADHILVLDAGQIVEDGSYDELMEKDGLFAQLVRRQVA